MTSKEIFNNYIKGTDFIEEFIQVLNDNKAPYCVIGGIAVNAYAEPLYSEDLDLVVAAKAVPGVIEVLKKKFKVEQFRFDYNITKPGSKLRIQITTDERYQKFVDRAKWKKVFGINMPVAAIEDIFDGKIWAATDPDKRLTKQLKDKTDIARLLEVKPELENKLPNNMRDLLPKRKKKNKSKRL